MSEKVLLDNIERLLKLRKVSAHAASEAAGVPDAIRNLRRSVRGETKTKWNIDTLEAIAAELGTSSWELLRPPGEMPRDEEFREYVRAIVDEQLAAPPKEERRRRR